jgi:NitT/TauT family transport system substrate-binding protein
MKTKLNRREVLAGLGVAATVPFTSRAIAADTVHVNFGYIPDDAVGSLVAIANAKDMWKKYGLDANLVSFTNGPSQVVAMEAGSIDAGFVGPGAMWLPASGRTLVIGINVVDLTDVVLGQPSGGDDIASLRGKTVGVPEGTSGEMILREALAKAGMTIDDVRKVNLDPATLVPAFISGSVDAAAFWYPPAGTILEKVPGAKQLATDADFYPELAPVSGFLASPAAVKNNREGLVRLMAVLCAAMDYRVANIDEATKLDAELTGLSEDIIGSTLKSGKLKLFTTDELIEATKAGRVVQWLDARNELFISLKTIDKAIPAKDYYLADIFLEGAAKR